MGAEVIVKTTVGEAAKDAYKALKEKIAEWAGNDVVALEKMPSSTNRQAVIAETVDQQPLFDKALIQALVYNLLEALEQDAQNNPIGIEIDFLKAARIHLASIAVTEGCGFRAREVDTPGEFAVGPVVVGSTLGKTSR
jgi:hypothetical protein